MNKLCFTGHLGKNAELKSTQSGKRVCDFSVAMSSGFGDKEQTTWVRCRIWGKRAEGKLPPLLIRGTKVGITGEVSLNEWTGQDGVKHAMLVCNVDSIDLLGQSQQAPLRQPSGPVAGRVGGSMPQQQAPQQSAPIGQPQNQGFQQPPQFNDPNDPPF